CRQTVALGQVDFDMGLELAQKRPPVLDLEALEQSLPSLRAGNQGFESSIRRVVG
mgnify:CR=1